MKSIAVLLTVHNRKEKTLECLSYLYQQKIPEGYYFDVYLTNDGCTDGTPEVVKQHYPSVNIIDGDGNLFWNRGMYKAWESASSTQNYDYYFWLNDDTTLKENALSILISSSELKNDESIIVGTTVSTKDSNRITYGGRTKSAGLLKPSKELILCELFNGNIALIPNSVFKIVGTNDFIFRHALGDFDYGLRAGKLGVKSYIAPEILGACDEHESLSTWCNPKQPFTKRWKAFRKPTGHNPEKFFIFEKRHKGILIAIFHYFTNHLRVMFPFLWNK